MLGTGLLVAAVVGSGIMGQSLSAGNVAIALLANTIATGAALVALILTFRPISGAHLNPVVTLGMATRKLMPWSEVTVYVGAQFVGGVMGTLLAHVMFGKELYSLSHHQRSGLAQLVSEFVAAFGLLCVIWGCRRDELRTGRAYCRRQLHHCRILVHRVHLFREPGVTVARSITDTFREFGLSMYQASFWHRLLGR